MLEAGSEMALLFFVVLEKLFILARMAVYLYLIHIVIPLKRNIVMTCREEILENIHFFTACGGLLSL